MKIVVIGGTGLVGSKTIVLLRSAGHDALAAAPDTGVNTLTGADRPPTLPGATTEICARVPFQDFPNASPG